MLTRMQSARTNRNHEYANDKSTHDPDSSFVQSRFDPTLSPPPGREGTVRPSPYTSTAILDKLIAAGLGKLDRARITPAQYSAALRGEKVTLSESQKRTSRSNGIYREGRDRPDRKSPSPSPSTSDTGWSADRKADRRVTGEGRGRVGRKPRGNAVTLSIPKMEREETV